MLVGYACNCIVHDLHTVWHVQAASVTHADAMANAQGSLISSVLIFLVLFVGYVWEQVRFHWNIRHVEARWEQEQQQQQQQQQPPLEPQVCTAAQNSMLQQCI